MRGPRTPSLPRDIVAGVSVALVLIPQSLAYAELAGLPREIGLFAASVPPIAAALFASSPYLQTGPVALTSLLTLGALLPLAATGSPEYVGMAAILALVVGVSRVVIGVLRTGWISYLMSQPMMLGFTSAAGVLILASQLPGALGVTVAGEGVLARAANALASPSAWSPWAIAISLITLACIFGLRRVHRRIPGVLVATLVGIGLTLWAGYDGPTVGVLASGLPGIELSLPWSRLPSLIVPGFVIALVGFAEAAAISRTYAAKDRAHWDPDREFLGQGAANLASGLIGGFPVGGSFSRSSVNRLAGATTRRSGAVTGLAVLAFLPAAWLLAPLPTPVLSAIVIAAIAGLVDIAGLVLLFRLSGAQAVVGVATFFLTLLLAPRVDLAVLAGVGLSGVVHMLRERKLEVQVRDEENVISLWPRGVLWFASANELETAFLDHVEGSEADRLVIHMGGLGRVDLSAALTLAQLVGDAEAAGVDVEFVDVPAHAKRVMRAAFPERAKNGADPVDAQSAGA